jgi:hypothetical protein
MQTDADQAVFFYFLRLLDACKLVVQHLVTLSFVALLS